MVFNGKRAAWVASSALVATMAATGVAAGADLPPLYAEPLYVNAPEIRPVEIGTGWYLRGDVGYNFQDDSSFDGFDSDTQGGFRGGVGFGYQFTDYFRGDLTANYAKDDYEEIGALAIDPEADTYDLMANIYVDLGTYVGFTPYVGAGVGGVYRDFDEDGPFYEGRGEWRFAYSLMAGLGYRMSKNLTLDVGYRYLDADGAETFERFDGRVFEDDGYQRHSVTAGLRYSLW